MHGRRLADAPILRAMTETYVSSIAAQIIGRVFTHDGAFHFVLDTDARTGMARCSRRTAAGPGISYLPMDQVRAILVEQGSMSPDEIDPAFDDDEDDDE